MYYQPSPFPPAPFYPVPPGCNLTYAVGANGLNQPADVALVQRLLNGVAPGDGGPTWPLIEDGLVAPATSQAIVQFAAAHTDPMDTIYPNAALHNMLCFFSTNAGLMANPYTASP